ncbi:alpha/beta hydrolase [Halalkalicoccus sp. NIPERK01]|uniref:alpha/beta hydrolase n=1 Tax=Halalkalicoccus sp. NIPERK01 TaxID=3053469 RepID=UPI00256EE40C|nr:prolyl oligopeptidase family serine peptidase [Halalkalicoccus sp. NIPERK01]MDL5361797.1 prolyl oligopeptidase family serine peptidase [Halalkalicoccus sp. NIPERK01]
MDDSPLEHVSKEPETRDGPASAVVLIHGRGTNERDLLPIAAELPDELHVLSVRAPDPLQGGYTWYELDLSAGGLHASQPHPEEFRRSLDLLFEFVEWAVEAYGIDPERVGLLGFSQGAITSLAALCERPEAYDWIVALNGYLADSHEDRVDGASGKPVFIGAGEADRIIPVERAERAAELLAGAGADVRFETYPVGHGTHPEEIRAVAEWVRERL